MMLKSFCIILNCSTYAFVLDVLCVYLCVDVYNLMYCNKHNTYINKLAILIQYGLIQYLMQTHGKYIYIYAMNIYVN